MGNFKIIMAVIVAIVLGYKFLYKNDNPDVPSNEAVVNSIYKWLDTKHSNDYKVNSCKVLQAGFAKDTLYSCNITITVKDGSNPPLTKDIGLTKNKGGLVPDVF